MLLLVILHSLVVTVEFLLGLGIFIAGYVAYKYRQYCKGCSRDQAFQLFRDHGARS